MKNCPICNEELHEQIDAPDFCGYCGYDSKTGKNYGFADVELTYRMKDDKEDRFHKLYFILQKKEDLTFNTNKFMIDNNITSINANVYRFENGKHVTDEVRIK